MPLRTPHTARGLVAGRAAFASASVSKGFLSPTSVPKISSSQRLTFLSPQSTFKAFSKPTPIGTRHCSSHSRFTMSGQDSPTSKEVRKYLQQSHDRIFENNKKWADEMRKKKPEFFKDLSAGQSPDYLWIGESRALRSSIPLSASLLSTIERVNWH